MTDEIERPAHYNFGQMEARRVLDYNTGTGVFRWRVKLNKHAHIGDIAGSIGSSGYRYISVHKRRYAAHRLAFLMMTGRWPTGQVDHIDRDRANNQWANLRECSNAENCQNLSMRRDNTSGITGVSLHRASGLWRACIVLHGKQKCIGYFRDPNDAALAYKSAKSSMHPFYVAEVSA